MTRLALRGLAARRLRTALTAFAIVLGVATITGALTLTGTMDRASKALSTASYDGTDAVVSTPTSFTSTDQIASTRPTVPADALERVRGVEGVEAAIGDVLDEARIIGNDGDTIGTGPYFGVGYDSKTRGAEQLQPFRLKDGAWATGPGQVVIDAGTADKQDWNVGDRITVATAGPAKKYEVTGIATFGDVKSMGTATFAVFDLQAAQQIYGKGDGFDSVLVAGRDGTDPAAIRKAVAAVTPGLQVQTAVEQDRFTLDGLDEFIGIIRVVLLVFGGVALLVGSFTIVNSLSITVAQRTRELALMRALGAGKGHVRRNVLAEAGLLGLGASVVGIVAGVGLAKLINSLFVSLGLDLPSAETAFGFGTILTGLIVGTGVTLLAALRPARKATKVSPVEAMREGGEDRRPKLRTRATRAVVGLVGRPSQRVGGAPGLLARRNAMRQPGRTTATAAALTVGVALVAAVAVIGAGIKDSAKNGVSEQVRAGHILQSKDGWSATDPAAADALRKVPGVDAVAEVRKEETRAFGDTAYVDGIDPKDATAAIRYERAGDGEADLSTLGGDGALVTKKFAESHSLREGSRFTVEASSGKKLGLTVAQIHEPPTLNPLWLAEVTVANETFDKIFGTKTNYLTLVAGSPDQAAVDRVTAAYPSFEVITRAELTEQAIDSVDALLGIFYVLLALAVIVSLFGIVNTLALSVLERTRELGMLKAAGMTRRQVKRMVRHESVITSLLGALMGIAAGLGIAAIVTTVFADEGLTFALPVGSIVAFVVIAIVAGVAAAVLPARRASRMDVLAALAYE